MNYRNYLLLPALALATSAWSETRLSVEISSKQRQADAPVVVSLANYGEVRTATVTIDGQEVACQLDDLDRDGTADELAFLADLSKSKTVKANIVLSDEGQQKDYPARTFAEMVLRNPKVKEKNKHDIYLTSITIDKQTANPYNVLHHHGVAFESELIAVRIYMDKRQTLDLYGKFHKGLELRETQFYTTADQKTKGYGDDILWVGNTFGLGALRGWDGTQPTMLDDVDQRTQRIVAQGPVRTIVEVEDNQWIISPGTQPVNMTLRYTLYAGHRDIEVDASFNRDMTGTLLSSGVVNVKGSEGISLGETLAACWGTDYPSTDTVNWKRETVGLAIYVPRKHVVKAIPANKDNYGMVLRTEGSKLHYALAYTSDNEDFGYHSASEWTAWLKEWQKRQEAGVEVKIEKL